MSQSLTLVPRRAVRNQPNMLWQILSIFVLAVAALGYDHPAVSQYKITVKHPVHHGHHGKLSHFGSHAPEYHKDYAWTYPSYEYSYHVDDPHTHDQKGQHEKRHGDEVKGMYWLIQPNGIKRMVRYHADKHSGFKADVEYLKPMDHDHEHKHYVHEHKAPDQKRVMDYYEHKNNEYDNDYLYIYDFYKKEDEHKHHVLIDHEHKPYHHDDYGYYYGHKYG